MQLFFPVIEKRSGTDDERTGIFILVVILRDRGNRLHRFSKAHIIGQNSVQDT